MDTAKSTRFKVSKSLGILAFSSLILFSCAQPAKNLSLQKNEKADRAWFQKKHKQIVKQIQKEKLLARKGKDLKKSLDWYLNAGSIARYAYDLNLSFKLWDLTDEQINLYERNLLAGKIAEEVVSLLTNDLSRPYRPPIYERVYLNFAQALNDLSMNRFDDANIELNRALERLKHAEQIFKKEVEQAEKEMQKKSQEKGFRVTDKTLSPIEKAYSNLDNFKPYSKFENPAVYYLKGILYYESGDLNNAADMFKITYGLIKDREPASKIVAEDWNLLNNPSTNNQHYLWVIYLNGLSFAKEQKVFHIPLFLISRDVLYTGIALPWLVERPKTSNTLYIQTSNGTYRTNRLVDMDSLVAWEFKKRLPSIVFREILRAALKSGIQYGAKKIFGSIGQLAAAVYQYATTQADTRQWYWLPKEIQIARITFKPNETIKIKVPGHPVKEFKFDNTVKDAIIIVRGFKPNDEVLYYEALFKQNP